MKERKVVFTVDQIKRLLEIIEEEGTNDALDYIYNVADEQGISVSDGDDDGCDEE